MKPLRIFRSPLSLKYYAVRSYREVTPGVFECTGNKEDITDQIERIVKDRLTKQPADGEKK